MAVAAIETPPRRRARSAPARADRGTPPGWRCRGAWYALFFVCPLGIMAVFSSRGGRASPTSSTTSTSRTTRTSVDPLYGQVFPRTLGLAAVGTIATLVIGFPLAYYLARWARHKTLLLLLVVVPFWTSILIRTYAWLILLDPDFPLCLLRDAGCTSGDFSLLYTSKAVYIGVVYTYLPLMVLPLYAALERWTGRWSRRRGPRRRAVAGVPPHHASARGPGIVAGSLLVFIPMLGEYLNPVILGGDKTIYVGNLIGQQFLTRGTGRSGRRSRWSSSP